jgi:hypothetical protein
VELTCELSPLVYAELYRLLLADDAMRQRVEDRLDDARADASWLGEAERLYRRSWESQIESEAFGDIRKTSPADPRDAQLATWLIAPLRALGSSTQFSADLQREVNLAARVRFPEFNDRLPDQYQASVIAWTLGRVCGELDRSFPVILAEVPDDTHVAAAYEGLLHHVSTLTYGPNPWPEMAGSAVVWRVGGIADGLRPRDPNNLRASLDLLMSALRPVVPPVLYTELNASWNDFVEARNGLTHVAPRDGLGFADFAKRMRAAEEVRTYVQAATYFVCNEVAMSLAAGDDGHRGRDRMLVERLALLDWLS